MRILGFGKSRLQKQLEEFTEKRETEERERQRVLEEEVTEALRKIYLFPKSKSEFDEFIGEQTEAVNFGKGIRWLFYDEGYHNRFRLYNSEFRKRIADSGTIALVGSEKIIIPYSALSALINSNADPDILERRSQDNSLTELYFGMPVKKKNNHAAYDSGIDLRL